MGGVRETGRDVRLLRCPRVRPDRYATLLTLLVVSFLLSAYGGGTPATVVRVALFVVTLYLALRTSLVRRRVARVVLSLTVVGSATTVGLSLGAHSRVAAGVLDAWLALVLLLTVLVILRRVLSHTVVSVRTILGALSAYLIVGLMFAAGYGVLSELGQRPFFAHGAAVNPAALQYFSFVTLTTLGYGDYTPATNTGRAFAVLEALGGQIFLVTLVARLVAAFRPEPRRRAETAPGRPHRRPLVRAAPRRGARRGRAPAGRRDTR
jgi:voltage-gated potassium channel Kch